MRVQLRDKVFMLAVLALAPVSGFSQTAPEPNPPLIPAREEPARVEPLVQPPLGAPSVEWILHKSADGADPSPGEQKMMWLMNRARRDPTAEGIWLATDNRADIKGGRDFFNVNLTELQADFAALEPKAPAAFDIRLHDASELHSEDLIARDAQDHTGQFEKVQASGFSCNGARLSVFSFADNAVNAHAALNIDWGSGSGGTQDPPGHRYAIMGVYPSPPGTTTLSNVGLALVAESNQGTQVGPQVFSGAYCHAGGTDHNRFIVGTVWEDTDDDGEYDEGEGLGGVSAMPDAGTYYAVTGDAGGYAIPIEAAGTYQVTFSGGGLAPAVIARTVTLGADSVLLDLDPNSTEPIIGTSGADNLFGTAGDDVIDGKGGADVMTGLAGNDLYYVQHTGDTVVEVSGEGSDTVRSSITYKLPANVEKLILTGSSAINGTGNSRNNMLTGNNAANTLNGAGGTDVLNARSGNDRLIGGPGSDTLTGGPGKDQFLFNAALGTSNIDKITDFNPADDTIRLENKIFTALATTGTLASSAFRIGAAATTTAHRILYDPATGYLRYDPDGTGPAAARRFATLTTKPAVTRTDFVVQ
jgi:Ca2+-binding RTX toxin-like protein